MLLQNVFTLLCLGHVYIMRKLLLLVSVLFSDRCDHNKIVTHGLWICKKFKNVMLEMNYNLSTYVDADFIIGCVMLLLPYHRSGEVT